MIVELFKGDALEQKVFNVMQPELQSLGEDHDDFYEQAYQAQPLGDILFNTQADILTQAIAQDVYRRVFSSIHALSNTVGTFDFWIEVLSAVWAETDSGAAKAAIVLDVPSPGILNINVNGFAIQTFEAATQADEQLVTEADEQLIFTSYQRTIDLTQFLAQARLIESNQVVLYDLITQAGDNIVFVGFDGKLTPTQAQNFVFQLSVYGVVTTINLNFLN